MGPQAWDRNGNGILDPGEQAPCSNGHRLSQVWLGPDYGWTCFDGTPTRPPQDDYSKPPRRKTQWRFMDRAAGGLRNAHRLVFNIGSQFIEPLYRDYEYDAELARNNNCGGDQRYNLQGRYEKPTLWKGPRHRIWVTSPCTITDIRTSGSTRRTLVTWKTEGPWHLEPDARLEIHLVTEGSKVLRRLAADLPWHAGRCTLDLSPLPESAWHLRIRRVGDPIVGGCSCACSLPTRSMPGSKR